MTFADIISLLSKELGITLEIEGDICAVRMNATDGTEVTILLRGLDRQGAVLLEASLGSPRPEGLERLYRTLLEANDLFRDTGGATLSLAPDTGRVRLQRVEPFEALALGGVGRAFAAFADTAAAWQALVADWRDVPPVRKDGESLPPSYGLQV